MKGNRYNKHGNNYNHNYNHREHGQNRGYQGGENRHQHRGISNDIFNFGNDFDFGFGIHDEIEDPFDKMFEDFGGRGFGFPRIGDIHKEIMNKFNSGFESGSIQQFSHGGPGRMISKTFCSRVDMSGGQPREERYQSQVVSQIGKDGHRISEKQEAYKNSMTGEQKAAHQRILDDKGIKQIRRRNTKNGEQEEHNIYKGMNEEDLGAFEQNYNDYRQKSNFQENYKYLSGIGNERRREIGDEPYMQRRAPRRSGPKPMALPSGKY